MGIDVYSIVTERIIKSLEAGVIPWEKPWKSTEFKGGPFPRNFRSGKEYRGINVMLLWSSGFSSPFWVTYKQATELGGTVRKGEKGTPIVFYQSLRNRKQAKLEDKPFFVLRYYTVFNTDQCDGLKIPVMIPSELPAIGSTEADDTCDAIVNGWENRPTLNLGSAAENRAYYRPATDTVNMPLRSKFVTASHYYSTLFHELVHSTGHETRLGREFGKSFGDDVYSKEELVAEMGAAFLSAMAGISDEHTERNTTAYLQNWIAKLKSDSKLIMQAAGGAQKAVDSIVGKTFEVETETEEPVADAVAA